MTKIIERVAFNGINAKLIVDAYITKYGYLSANDLKVIVNNRLERDNDTIKKTLKHSETIGALHELHLTHLDGSKSHELANTFYYFEQWKKHVVLGPKEEAISKSNIVSDEFLCNALGVSIDELRSLFFTVKTKEDLSVHIKKKVDNRKAQLLELISTLNIETK